MDIDNLRAFCAVAHHKSFSLAANALFITQPAVSKRIIALENELNHALFDRLGKHVMLTEAGTILLPRAQAIIKEISQTKRFISELSGQTEGVLQIATSHHIGLHHLPPILRQYTTQYPDVDVRLEFLDSEIAHNKVLGGEIDMAIVTLDPSAHHSNKLMKERLWHDPLCFVTSVDHPLSIHSNISLEDLSKANAVLPGLSTYTGQIVKSCFDTQSIKLNVSMTTNYLETIKMMVSVGLGWSVLPATITDSNMHIFNPHGIQLSRDLGVIALKNRSHGNAANAFLEVLRNAIQPKNKIASNRIQNST